MKGCDTQASWDISLLPYTFPLRRISEEWSAHRNLKSIQLIHLREKQGHLSMQTGRKVYTRNAACDNWFRNKFYNALECKLKLTFYMLSFFGYEWYFHLKYWLLTLPTCHTAFTKKINDYLSSESDKLCLFLKVVILCFRRQIMPVNVTFFLENALWIYPDSMHLKMYTFYLNLLLLRPTSSFLLSFLPAFLSSFLPSSLLSFLSFTKENENWAMSLETVRNQGVHLHKSGMRKAHRFFILNSSQCNILVAVHLS